MQVVGTTVLTQLYKRQNYSHSVCCKDDYVTESRNQPITDISKIFKSCFLLDCQKCNVFYALPFFKNLRNQDL